MKAYKVKIEVRIGSEDEKTAKEYLQDYIRGENRDDLLSKVQVERDWEIEAKQAIAEIKRTKESLELFLS